MQIAKMVVGTILQVFGGETKMATQDNNLFLSQEAIGSYVKTCIFI